MMRNDDMKKNINIILLFSAFVLLGTIGIIFSMIHIDDQTDNTTTYYSATVFKVEITNIKEDTFAEIYTKEYESNLRLSTNICENININDVRNLKNGQKIFFRIENLKSEQMNKVEFINIVSLKTEEKDIFTLDDYNNYISAAAYPTRIASIVVALLSLSVSIYCVFYKIIENQGTVL